MAPDGNWAYLFLLYKCHWNNQKDRKGDKGIDDGVGGIY